MKVVLQCQNQDALRSAHRRPATSQNNAGSKHPDRSRSVFRQIQVLAPQLWQNGTFAPNNVNAGGSAISIQKDLLPDEAMVTYVITCHGRDHIVNIRSRCRILVIANVHFEPELTPRSLRER